MNIVSTVFMVWAFIAISFFLATIGKEMRFQMPALNRVGDTSLGRHSVDWMVGIALAAAVMICFFLP